MRRSAFVAAVSSAVLALGLASSAIAASSHGFDEVFQFRGADFWKDPKDTIACNAQPSLPWCGRTGVVMAANSSPARLDPSQASAELELIAWAEKVARARWSAPETTVYEEVWGSFADQALANKKWVGDCDNLTFTVLDLMARQGFPADRMYRLDRKASRPGILHMVGAVKLSDGRYIIVGDSMAKGSYAAPSDWPVLAYNIVADGIVWQDMPSAAAFWASVGQ